MYREEIEKFFREHEREMFDAIGRLVRIQSVREEARPGMPFGPACAQALAEAERLCDEMGLFHRNVDNHVIVAESKGKEAKLGIVAHLDIVAAGEGWDTDPFTMTFKGDRIYGRGVQDDKGPAVASLFALKAAQEINPGLKYGARVILGSAEETGCEDFRYYRKKETLPEMMFSPDGKFPLINVEKGLYAPKLEKTWEADKTLPRVVSVKGGKTRNVVPSSAEAVVEGVDVQELERICRDITEKTEVVFAVTANAAACTVTASGKSAHSSNPQNGRNALIALLCMLSALPLAESESAKAIRDLTALFPWGDHDGAAAGVAMSDKETGRLTVNPSVMELGETGYTLQVDMRIPLCSTEENTKLPMQAACEKYGITMSDAVPHMKAHYVPCEGNKFVETLLNIYEEYTGEPGRAMSIGGMTYVHSVENGVAFGCSMPATKNDIHSANEYAVIDELLVSAKMFTQAILTLCGQGDDGE